MKRSELLFSFLLVPLDYLMIVLAGVGAYYIRFSKITTDIRPAVFDLKFSAYFEILLLIALLWIIIFSFAGLYNIRSARKVVQEFYRVVLACSTGFMAVVVIIFLQRELFESRFIVLVGWILSIFFIMIARILVRALQRFLFKFNFGVYQVVLVGSSSTSIILKDNFFSQKRSGYQVVKEIASFSVDDEIELLEFIKNNKVDEIVQGDPGSNKEETIRLLYFADENHIDFKYVANLFGTNFLNTEVVHVAGVPIIEVKKTPLEGWGRIVKRFFDIFGALAFIALFSPLMFFISICIKIDSKGNIVYKNKRVGKSGGFFELLKFRSFSSNFCINEDDCNAEALEYEKKLIKTNSEKEGPIYKIGNDPRVTRVGKFIRRWSIDELPQFFNVLFGSMSLVGPRPHQPREVAKYEKHHKKVLTIKPGITGMAQISGRSDLSFEEEVKLDRYYIENWSLLMDLGVLLRTPLAILKSRKVE